MLFDTSQIPFAFARNLSNTFSDNLCQPSAGFFGRLDSSYRFTENGRAVSQVSLQHVLSLHFLHSLNATTGAALRNLKWTHLIAASLFFAAIYLVLVQALRFRRSSASARYWRKKFPTRASFSNMTVDDAFVILLDLQQLELPLAFEVGLAGALYRPHGIPTISRVVTTTKQFANAVSGGKRVADSIVMIADFCQHAPTSSRACGAIARMNYIHLGYQKSGLVSHQDMLYTLALLAWLPVRFVERYEWRQLSDIELNAIGVFWKSIGDAMKIPYTGLDSANAEDSTWPCSDVEFADGLQFMDEMCTWSERYEVKYMVPHESNRKAAADTEHVLFYSVPSKLTVLARHGLAALMDDRLRHAIMLPDPPKWLSSLVFVAMQIRWFLMRFASLPRYTRALRVSEGADANGRFHRCGWPFAAAPWYVISTFARRWGPRGWVEWANGRAIPGDRCVQAEGYVHEELGPKAFRGRGTGYQHEERERLVRSGRGRCPFG